MCSKYQPVPRMDRLLTFFGVEREKDGTPGEVFPLGMAPFIRLAVTGQEGGKPSPLARATKATPPPSAQDELF